MNIKLVGILFAVGSLLACGDSGTGGSGGGSAGGTAGGSPPTTGGGDTGGAPGTGGSGGSAALTCTEACTILFECGLEGEPPLCVYTTADQAGYVPTCEDACAEQPVLINLIDPKDCEGTIGSVSGVSPEFNSFCDNGAPQGGAGGGA